MSHKGRGRAQATPIYSGEDESKSKVKLVKVMK